MKSKHRPQSGKLKSGKPPHHAGKKYRTARIEGEVGPGKGVPGGGAERTNHPTRSPFVQKIDTFDVEAFMALAREYALVPILHHFDLLSPTDVVIAGPMSPYEVKGPSGTCSDLLETLTFQEAAHRSDILDRAPEEPVRILEFETYLSNLDLLLKNEGKFVLIRGTEIVGIYGTEEDAARDGIARFGAVPVMVQQIRRLEPAVSLGGALL